MDRGVVMTSEDKETEAIWKDIRKDLDSVFESKRKFTEVVDDIKEELEAGLAYLQEKVVEGED